MRKLFFFAVVSLIVTGMITLGLPIGATAKEHKVYRWCFPIIKGVIDKVFYTIFIFHTVGKLAVNITYLGYQGVFHEVGTGITPVPG